MKRNLTLLLVGLMLLAAATACSAGTGNPGAARPPAPDQAIRGTGDVQMDSVAPQAPGASADFAASESAPAGGNGGGQSSALRDAKLIRKAYLEIQSLDFPQAVAALEDLTGRLEGYLQDSSINGGDFYEKNAMRSASFTVRVPQARYDDFLNVAGDVGHIVNRSQSQEDVGDVYYDTELRLKTQKVKQARLLNLLEQAELMEDIIALENALSEVEYEIEGYTTTLKRYDALVDYATIEVRLTEVLKLDDSPAQTLDTSTRMVNAFSQGLERFGAGLENLLVWLAYHLVGVVVFVAVVTVVAVVVARKLRKQWALSENKVPEDKDGTK